MPRPGVFRRRIERRAREVEPDRSTRARSVLGTERLGLEAREDAQRLRVSLEAADRSGDLVEGVLAVVPEGRVPEVVRQAGDLHKIGIASQGPTELATDLGALERVRQAGAQEVALAGDHHLGLGSEAAQCCRVQHAGPIASERRAPGALRRFLHPARLVTRRIPG